MRNYYDSNGVFYVEEEAPLEEETAESLIARFENETGCRIDSDNFQNLAVAGLMGAMSRMLGTNPHGPDQDVVAGLLIQHQLSPAGQKQRQADEALADLLRSGVANLLFGD